LNKKVESLFEIMKITSESNISWEIILWMIWRHV
jgi:hypothetical protein